jgi:hypothetical protein
MDESSIFALMLVWALLVVAGELLAGSWRE